MRQSAGRTTYKHLKIIRSCYYITRYIYYTIKYLLGKECIDVLLWDVGRLWILQRVHVGTVSDMVSDHYVTERGQDCDGTGAGISMPLL